MCHLGSDATADGAAETRVDQSMMLRAYLNIPPRWFGKRNPYAFQKEIYFFQLTIPLSLVGCACGKNCHEGLFDTTTRRE
jgi:hypothetical protein